MYRVRWQFVGLLCMIFCLAACEAPGQQVIHSSTPTATRPGVSLFVPAHGLTGPSPTPGATATPTAHPTVPAPGGSTPSPIISVGSQLEQQLLALINRERAAQNLYTYVLNSTLSSGARLHSMKMASCGLSHQCPGEPDPCQRVSNEGITWTSCGENVGYSSPNPTLWAGVQSIEQDMLNEQPPNDGHRLNLLSSSFHRVGVGIYIDSRQYVWITEDFAS